MTVNFYPFKKQKILISASSYKFHSVICPEKLIHTTDYVRHHDLELALNTVTASEHSHQRPK